MIEILSSFALNTVQDLGRPGFLALGVSHAGAMDREALAFANRAVGNSANAAGFEVVVHPFRLRTEVDTIVAVTGADCDVRIGDVVHPPWLSVALPAGQTLSVETPRWGARSYVALAGGIDVPRIMGSRSTDLKTGFGGNGGRGVIRGDRLPLGPALRTRKPGFGAALDHRASAARTAAGTVSLRVVPAAEFEAFTPPAREAFFGSQWSVTKDANRMGCRLAGPHLALAAPLDLFSHGLMPGTVQVPPAGQPIIQLADANTCGGYPKIAAVIEADLWRLAQAPVGALLTFERVTIDEAVEAARAQAVLQDRFTAARDFAWGWAEKALETDPGYRTGPST